MSQNKAKAKGRYNEVVLISPDQARAWLDSMPPEQRKRSAGVVENYLYDMNRGKWCSQSPQPIAIGEDGMLYDGQHRLQAIIRHGKPVAMEVAFNVSREAYPYMDLGLKRAARDTARAFGVEVSKDACAVARAAYFGADRSGKSRATHGFISDLVLALSSGIKFVDERVGKKKLAAPLKGALVLAYFRSTEEERELLDLFIRAMATSEPATPRQHIATKWMSWYQESPKEYGTSGRKKFFLILLRVILAYYDNIKLSRFYTPDECPFEPLTEREIRALLDGKASGLSAAKRSRPHNNNRES